MDLPAEQEARLAEILAELGLDESSDPGLVQHGLPTLDDLPILACMPSLPDPICTFYSPPAGGDRDMACSTDCSTDCSMDCSMDWSQQLDSQEWSPTDSPLDPVPQQSLNQLQMQMDSWLEAAAGTDASHERGMF